MAQVQVEKKRNIAIFGHHGAGKTTLVESFLFHKKKLSRIGRPQDGNTFSDFTDEEKKRGHSIYTTLINMEHNKHQLNLLDLPGFFDFTGEIRGGLHVADGALAVINATAGIEVETEKIWDLLEEQALPRMMVVNQLDKDRTDFGQVLQGVQAQFGVKCVAVQLPIGQAAEFSGVIDLITEKALMFTSAGGHEQAEIPADMMDAVVEAREKLFDCAAEVDEEVMEKYLGGEQLTQEEFIGGLKKAVLAGSCVPVFCAASNEAKNSLAVLDGIVDYMPSPDMVTSVKATKAGTDETVELVADPKQPVAGYVFKTRIDPFSGKWSFIRVYSGTITQGKTLMLGNKDESIRIANILQVSGQESGAVDEAGPGDIVAVAKIDELETGDTICETNQKIVIAPPDLPPQTIMQTIHPASKNDEEKMGAQLNRLEAEDPTLTVKRDVETHEIVVSGMGEIHLQVACNKLRDNYGISTELSVPKVAYRETISGKSEGSFRHKKQTGGHGQFAEVHLRMAPQARGEGSAFINEVVGGTIPTKFIPAVEKGVNEALTRGIQAGFPVVDVAVTVFFGKAHDVDSSEMAFKLATSKCFRQVAAQCTPILLEPIMDVEIKVPEANMGEVISSLNTKRGRVMGMDPMGKYQLVKAQVPMAEMFTYSVDLRSITQGRGSFVMNPSHYDPVPTDVAMKIISASGGVAEDDE